MAWGQSIAQSLGNACNAWGDAVDHNLDQALKVIQNRLLSQEIQGRLQEQQQRLKRMNQPQPYGTVETQQGLQGLTFNPQTGKYDTQSIAPAAPVQHVPMSEIIPFAANYPEKLRPSVISFLTQVPVEEGRKWMGTTLGKEIG